MPAAAHADTSPPASGPAAVVLVHGFGCGSINDVTAAAMALHYGGGIPIDRLHVVDFYACDGSADAITGFGSRSRFAVPHAPNDADTSLERIGYELAWYLWHNFGSRGTPVDLVGHSLGGLVITYALQHIAKHAPGFPPSLTVPNVVTLATPYSGVPAWLCQAVPSVECGEMLPGSSFLTSLDATGAVPVGTTTRWTVVGSEPCDLISPRSALALPHVTYAVDYTSPCYDHVSYVYDTSWVADARGTINGVPFEQGLHAMALLIMLLG